MQPTERLHSLTIDFARASAPVRACFALDGAEIRHLLQRAGRDGTPLVICASRTHLTLISTREAHVRAFRPILAKVRQRALPLAGWRELRVQLASGSDAARKFVQQAIFGLADAVEHGDFVGALRGAVELSGVFGALSGELDALARLTERVVTRVGNETSLAAGPSNPEIAMETLVAERIAEEELVAWQSSQPRARSSLHPLSGAEPSVFGEEERHSMVRLRAASAGTAQRTA